MTGSTLLTDLIAWSAQVACIVAIGGLLPTLLRLEAPGVRYYAFGRCLPCASFCRGSRHASRTLLA